VSISWKAKRIVPMNIQCFKNVGKGLYWILLFLGGCMCLTEIEIIPVWLGFVLLFTPLVFPGVRRRIHWPRTFIFSLGAMLALLGIFYWVIFFYNPFDSGLLADCCWLLVWPLGDMALAGSVPQVYWLPIWILQGLFWGYMAESLVALGKQAWAGMAAAPEHEEEPQEANRPPLGTAGGACLTCMAVLFLVIQPFLSSSHQRLTDCLLAVLFIIGPLSVAFAVFYFSSWSRQWRATQRIVALAWRSCAVLGVAWLLVAVMIVAVLAMVLLGYFGESSRGQYGTLG
jgi:hypothetical protein